MTGDPMKRLEGRLRMEAVVLPGYAHGHKLTHKRTDESMDRVVSAPEKLVAPRMFPSTPGRFVARAPATRSIVREGKLSAFPKRGNHARYLAYLANEDW